jgi:hypothetical protein
MRASTLASHARASRAFNLAVTISDRSPPRARLLGRNPRTARSSSQGRCRVASVPARVGQTNSSFIEKASERFPTFQHVIHYLRHIGVTRQAYPFGAHRLVRRCNQLRTPNLPCCAALFRGETVDLTLDIEDRIDPPHRLDRERCFRGVGEHEQLASAVRPARGLQIGTGLHAG